MIGFNERVTNEINGKLTDILTEMVQYLRQEDVSVSIDYLVEFQDACWTFAKKMLPEEMEA